MESILCIVIITGLDNFLYSLKSSFRYLKLERVHPVKYGHYSNALLKLTLHAGNLSSSFIFTIFQFITSKEVLRIMLSGNYKLNLFEFHGTDF